MPWDIGVGCDNSWCKDALFARGSVMVPLIDKLFPHTSVL
jgi:hypothetical protein